MATTEKSKSPPPKSQAAWHIPEALAGWVVPGLGHWLMGRRARGVTLGVTIAAIWLGGLLMGGVSTFDRRQHTAWFGFCQVWVAPAIVVDQLHQRMRGFQTPQPPQPGDPAPAYEPAYGRMHEQALLFTSLAGLMNLLVIFDIAYCDPKQFPENRPPADPKAPADGPAAGSPATAANTKPAAA